MGEASSGYCNARAVFCSMLLTPQHDEPIVALSQASFRFGPNYATIDLKGFDEPN